MFSHTYNKIGICIKVLVKKVYQWLQNCDCFCNSKKAKMAQFGGKDRTLHVSYLLNEFGDPNFFSFFCYVLIIKFTPGRFQQIFISRTITPEYKLYFTNCKNYNLHTVVGYTQLSRICKK